MVQASTRTNPFPGLRPFELDEEHLFFGREGQADELLVRLNRTRFLGVVGASGSGKSSLARAGRAIRANRAAKARIMPLRVEKHTPPHADQLGPYRLAAGESPRSACRPP